MDSKPTTDIDKHAFSQPRTAVKVLLLLLGGVFMLVALLADQLGFGKPGSIGIDQVLLFVAGLALVVAAFIGRKVIDLYKGLAILMLNTLVLLGLLELASSFIISTGLFPSYQERIRATYRDVSYYAAQDWADAYWQELTQAEDYRYEPYTLWQHVPFDGEYINISPEGHRQTPGAKCTADAYKVFVFGGSTTWGWGVPDWGTTAAFLQDGFQSIVDGPVCVTNFGEDSFVSTQSVIALMKQLQTGNVPDAVIFYDGVNDVYTAYETGQAGVHSGLVRFATQFDNRGHPLVEWFRGTQQFYLVKEIARIAIYGPKSGRPLRLQHPQFEYNTMAESIAELYFNNYRIVRALAQGYGFEAYFFWQPHLAVDEKKLTDEEQRIKLRFDPAVAELANRTYENVASEAPKYETLWYIADVFSEQDAQIWTDKWGHLTPEGNRLVAEEMLRMIRSHQAD